MKLLPNVSHAQKGTAIKFILSIGQMSKYSEIEKELNEKGYNLQNFIDIFGFPVFGVFLAIPK